MNPPHPYHNKANKTKAFVLGCDPTAFKEGIRQDFEYVFGIKKDKRYFASINANLRSLSLDLECVYVQNLLTAYQDYVTSDHPNWKEEAQKYVKARKAEFDSIDNSGKLPVFLTSELLYKVLLNDGEIPMKPTELYNSETDFFIPANRNKLSRPLIPLYRHPAYSMKNKPEYAKRVTSIFNF